jgi:hypothetical protein
LELAGEDQQHCKTHGQPHSDTSRGSGDEFVYQWTTRAMRRSALGANRANVCHPIPLRQLLLLLAFGF